MKFSTLGGVAALILAIAPSSYATGLINGGFEDGTVGQFNYGGAGATGWYVPINTVPNGDHGYTFLENPSVAVDPGVSGEFGYHFFQIWGVGNGGPDPLVASPDGGNFIAQDGAFDDEPLEQDISGLTPGKSYTVGFYWADAQQNARTGATSDQWDVTLGNQPTQSTVAVADVSEGVTPWIHQTFTFTADAATDTLSFLAAGTPNGEPPLALLDGVTFGPAAIPEPSAWTVIMLGMFGAGASVRRRNSVRSGRVSI